MYPTKYATKRSLAMVAGVRSGLTAAQRAAAAAAHAYNEAIRVARAARRGRSATSINKIVRGFNARTRVKKMRARRRSFAGYQTKRKFGSGVGKHIMSYL